MIAIKSPKDLAAMRVAGRIARTICEAVAARVAPGMTTRELDDAAAAMMDAHGVKSAFRGYRGYPGTVCISVNEEVVHGIPGPRRIAMGDIVGIDVGVVARGFYGDTALTVMTGVTDPEVMRLVAVAEQALEAGIAEARTGRRLSDISHAIEQTVTAAGFSVVREFVGHGIGRRMHEEPQIPNFGPPGCGPKLAAGMTLAIEPMVNMGGADVKVLGDGWTVVTQDRRPSAHAEHTVAVGDTGADVLTRASGQDAS